MRLVYSAFHAAGDGSAHNAPAVRVFVGLKIVPEIAGQLTQFAAALEAFARPVAPEDIHITLVPPWNEISIPDAIDKLGRVAARFGAFPLRFFHVGYGPQPRRPRLLWAECAADAEISALHTSLLQTFGQTDKQPFRPHVTLARIRADAPAIARKHPVDQPLSLVQHIESIELFQSPPPGERGYRVLASLRLAYSAVRTPED
jgi:RNA 2',3'-cyclic 3'-phosphodiesterase